MNWVSWWVSNSCIAQRSPCLITFLPLCLHLHFLLHVYLYTCNGYGLHSSRISNSLMFCITLQPLLFQHLTSTLARTSLVMACIALEVLIISYISSLCISHVSTPYVDTCSGLKKEFWGISSYPKFCSNKENLQHPLRWGLAQHTPRWLW